MVKWALHKRDKVNREHFEERMFTKKGKKKMKKTIAYIVAIAGIGLQSNAQTILFDIGAPPNLNCFEVTSPVDGNYWNSVGTLSGAVNSNLVDMAGVPTGVHIYFDGQDGINSHNGPAGNGVPTEPITTVTMDSSALGDLAATNAVADYYRNSKFRITGLDPDKQYTVTLFGSHKYSNPGTTTYTLHTDSGYTNEVTSTTLAHNNREIDGQDWVHNKNRLAVFEKVDPQVDNGIYIDVAGFINAFKISEYVPPSGLVLVDFGADASYRSRSVVNPDQNANCWNSVHVNSTKLNLLDTVGIVTEIDLVTETAYVDSHNGPSGAVFTNDYSVQASAAQFDPVALGVLGATNAVFDFFRNSQFEIQGLDEANTYNLTFFSSFKYGDQTTRFEIHNDGQFTNILATVDLNQRGASGQHNQDTVASIDDIAPQVGGTIYVKFYGTNGTTGNGHLNAMSIEEIVPGDFSSYSSWAAAYPTLTGGEQDDSDGDTLNNLYEYAFGGNPTNGFVDGNIPTFTIADVGSSNVIEYVYYRRIGTSDLSYQLELGTDLVYTNWSGSGYTELPEKGVIDADFEAVTNLIPTQDAVKFIRLKVETN
jgi:hypothetical protein